MTNAILRGKSDAEKSNVRFGVGEVASTMPLCGPRLCKPRGKAAVAAVLVSLTASVWAERRVYVQMETSDLKDFEKSVEIARRFGATHVCANQIEPSMWQWDAAMNRKDPYPNWTMHRPSFFKFYVPEKLRKYLPADYANRNLEAVRARGEILRRHGLKAVYSAAIDPSYLPEQVYVDHPEWRGPRCDHPRRARLQYYAPCIDNPEIRAMYVEAIRELCKACPFEYFDVMCNDSGSGFCHFPLYPGENGPEWCRDIPNPVRLVNWLSTVQEGAAAAGCAAQVNFNRYLKNGIEIQARPLLKPGQSLLNKKADGKPATAIVGFPNRFGETSFPLAYLPRMSFYAKQLQDAERTDADLHVALKGTEEWDAISLVEKAFKKPIGQGQVARYRALADVAAEFVGADDAERLVSVWDDVEELLTRLDGFREGPRGANYGLLAFVHQRWLTRPLVCFPERLKDAERDYWRDYLFQATTEADALDYINLQGWNTLDGNAAIVWVSYVTDQTDAVFSRVFRTLDGLSAKGTHPQAAKYLKGLGYRMRLFRHLTHTFRHFVAFRNKLKLTRDEPMFKYYVTAETPYVIDGKKRDIETLMRREIGTALEEARIVEAADREGIRVLQTADRDEFTNVMNLPPVPRLVKEIRQKAAIMERHRNEPSEIYRRDHALDTNF